MKSALLICLLFCFSTATAKVKISCDFFGLHPRQIALDLPIGNYLNNTLQTRHPVVNDKFKIEFAITQPIFMRMYVGQRHFYLLVTPNSDIKIQYFNTGDKYNRIKFGGSNAAGQYWYSVYSDEPLANFVSHKGLISNIQLQSLDKSLVQLGQYINRQCYPMDSLYKAGKIDQQFYLLAKTDIRSMHAGHLIEVCKNLKENCENADLVAKYERIINALYRFAGCQNAINIQTYWGSMLLSSYYDFKLNENKLLLPASQYKLGPYNNYLLAPYAIRQYFIGDAMLSSKIIQGTEFDFDKNYKLYRREFPNSPFIPVIDKVILQKHIEKTFVKKVIVDTVTKFNHFEDVKQRFKGKAIYVDLWATWCTPCRMEFPYYDELNADFRRKNIQKVFISIDNPLAEYQWLNMVNQNQLDGYHILANKSLQADLRKVVYKMASVTVPRYILINKDGKVINWNELRPSNPDLLKAFDKLN